MFVTSKKERGEKKQGLNNIHPLDNYSHSYLSVVHLLFEIFWAQRPRGYHLFKMHIVHFNMLVGTLVSTQA